MSGWAGGDPRGPKLSASSPLKPYLGAPASRGREGMTTLEAALREPVGQHYRREGFAVRLEVPLNGRYADVVAQRGEELVAIELKLEDWREALAQAMHYQVAAHRAYIAMPLDHAILPLRQRSRLERQGIGLLGVHPLGEVRTLVEARESARRLPFLTTHTLAQWFRGPGPPLRELAEQPVVG